MTVQSTETELAGKTIEWAGIVERPSGDAEFLMRFSDGSTATVAAWKREAHPLEMSVDLTPNNSPTRDGGPATRRGM
jgi:hypothetical protein